VLAALRGAVQDAVKDDPLGYIRHEIPMSWLNVLDEMLRANAQSLNLDDVNEIAERCFADPKDVK
jgi:hypothetical protein